MASPECITPKFNIQPKNEYFICKNILYSTLIKLINHNSRENKRVKID